MKTTLTYLLRSAVLTLMLVAVAPAITFADVYVITHSGMAIAADDIKSVYIGEKELADSIKIKPQDNTAVRDEFLRKVLQLDAVKYDSLWTKKSFRDGINPPMVKANDAEVIAYVRATPGAIGYISVAPPSDVTVVKKF
jgi:hypothetical protein